MINALMAVLVTVFLCLPITSCSTIESLGDYINENPVFASIAARQAVGRYISAADTPEAEAQRASDVQNRITKVMAYVDGNPSGSVDGLLAVIDTAIDWDELVPADRMLVTDIVTLIEGELRQYDNQTPEISDTTKIAVRALLKVAVSAAEYYR